MKDKEYLTITSTEFKEVNNVSYNTKTRLYVITFKNIYSNPYGGRFRYYHLLEDREIQLPHHKKGLKVKTASGAEYYRGEKLHRESGPAQVVGDYVVYYRHGIKHRLGGPAEIFGNYNRIPLGPTRQEPNFYVNGKRIPMDVDFPIIDAGFSINNIEVNKSTILNAMLFDREYGKFLQLLEKFRVANNRNKCQMLKNWPLCQLPKRFKKVYLPSKPTYPSRKHRNAYLSFVPEFK